MSPSGRKSALMLGIVALAALVGADRMGWLPAAASADEPTEGGTPRDMYITAAESAAEDRALLESATPTESALTRATEQWQQLRSQCVVGKTAELAEASFRERILAATKDLGISSANAAPVRVETGAEPGKPADATLRPIALRVQFDTDQPQVVYRVIDVLENLPDIRTSITQVSVTGPGLPQVPTMVTASITIRALAVVGESEQ